MALRAFTATRSLAAKAPAMHGSWGQTAVGGQHKTKLVKDWFQGASAFAKEHGVVEMARRFFIDKDIRYMLPYVKKVGEDQFGNEYFEDNGTVENPQMKTRQRIVRYGGANNVVFNLPVETSVIPPEWFAWMHHMDDRVPPSGEKLSPPTENFVNLGSGMSGAITPKPYDHIAEHRPNQTTQVPVVTEVTQWSAVKGTQYKQPGHHTGGNHRISTYESWTPGTDAKVHIKTHGGVPVSSVEGGVNQL